MASTLVRVCVDNTSGRVVMVAIPTSDSEAIMSMSPPNTTGVNIAAASYSTTTNESSLLQAVQTPISQVNAVLGVLIGTVIATLKGLGL